MQNHLEISSKIQIWIRNVRNLTKSRDLVMSGLAKTCPGGQLLTANQWEYFFSEITPLHFLLTNLLSFYKIMCFTEQIYRRQVLIAKPRLYFFPDFTLFIFFISNFMIFHKN